MANARVEQLLEDLRFTNAQMQQLMLQSRQLIHASVKGLGEEVKYGGILFSKPSSFCGLFAYASHVSLEFGQGAALADPHGVLEGGGKYRRHIKLRQPSDLEGKHVADYVKQANATST